MKNGQKQIILTQPSRLRGVSLLGIEALRTRVAEGSRAAGYGDKT